MLGKLIKNEFKATAAQFIPLYIILFAISLLNRLLSTSWVNNLLNVLPRGFADFITIVIRVAFGFSILAFILVSFILLIQRFYRNLLGNEGYLMFTLPVKPWQHITSKTLVASFWTMLSAIATCFAVLLIIPEQQIFREFFSGMSEGFHFLAKYLEFPFWVVVLEVVLIFVIAFPCGYLMIYASIALGQLFGKSKKLGAFLSYFALNTITQIVSGIILRVLINTTNVENMIVSFAESQTLNTLLFSRTIHGIFIIQFVLSIVLSVGYFFITNYILSKKLNLE